MLSKITNFLNILKTKRKGSGSEGLIEDKIKYLLDKLKDNAKSQSLDNPSKDFQDKIEPLLKENKMEVDKITSKRKWRRTKKKLPLESTVVLVEETYKIINDADDGFIFKHENDSNSVFLFYLKGEIKSPKCKNEWREYCQAKPVENFSMEKIPHMDILEKFKHGIKIFIKKSVAFTYFSFKLSFYLIIIYLPLRTIFPSWIPYLPFQVSDFINLSTHSLILKLIITFLLMVIIALTIYVKIQDIERSFNAIKKGFKKKFFK